MGINEMTRKDFDELPGRKKWDEEILCDGIIILPGRAKDMHDSGYRLMDFVAIKNSKPVCRLSGCSDVIHIGGIGGQNVSRSWNIDCLPKSGLLRMWMNGHFIKVGAALSSFEITVTPKPNGN